MAKISQNKQSLSLRDKPVTRKMLDEAVATILGGMDNLYKMFQELLHKELKKELKPIKTEIVFIKRDIQDIKADRFDTPTREEFNKLKTRVETLQA